MAIAFTPIDIDVRKAIDFTSGDTVRVWSKIEDKGKYRLQAFEGLVLARKHGTDPQATFTVRKVSNNVGVERIFPLFSPSIDKIEITKRAKTRRSKLYYIRDKAAKEIRRKMKTIVSIGKGKKLEVPETVTEQPEASEE
jgi:large subunit ribosomal protein L19